MPSSRFPTRAGRRLRDARKATGLTERALASGAGIDPSYIRHLEAGRRTLTPEMAARIALALDINVKELA